MEGINIEAHTKEEIIEKLRSLYRGHRYCEDSWYSCPKAEDGCANDADGTNCNCRADINNATIDEIIKALNEDR